MARHLGNYIALGLRFAFDMDVDNFCSIIDLDSPSFDKIETIISSMEMTCKDMEFYRKQGVPLRVSDIRSYSKRISIFKSRLEGRR